MKKPSRQKPDNSVSEISRRSFLKSAAGGSAVLAATGSLAVEAVAIKRNENTGTTNPFDEVLHRCGSEFGDIRTSN